MIGMKTYKMNSGKYRQQKQTQREQRAAAARPVSEPKTGRKYLHPERRDRNGKLKEEFR